MAPQHVRLRRACPAPLDVACSAGRARLNTRPPDWERTTPHPRCVDAVPRGNDVPRNAAKQQWVGEVQGVLPGMLAQAGETGKRRGPVISWLKPRDFLAHFL